MAGDRFNNRESAETNTTWNNIDGKLDTQDLKTEVMTNHYGETLSWGPLFDAVRWLIESNSEITANYQACIDILKNVDELPENTKTKLQEAIKKLRESLKPELEKINEELDDDEQLKDIDDDDTLDSMIREQPEFQWAVLGYAMKPLTIYQQSESRLRKKLYDEKQLHTIWTDSALDEVKQEANDREAYINANPITGEKVGTSATYYNPYENNGVQQRLDAVRKSFWKESKDILPDPVVSGRLTANIANFFAEADIMPKNRSINFWATRRNNQTTRVSKLWLSSSGWAWKIDPSEASAEAEKTILEIGNYSTLRVLTTEESATGSDFDPKVRWWAVREDPKERSGATRNPNLVSLKQRSWAERKDNAIQAVTNAVEKLPALQDGVLLTADGYPYVSEENLAVRTFERNAIKEQIKEWKLKDDDFDKIPNYKRYVALDAAVTAFEIEEQKTRAGAEKAAKLEQTSNLAASKVAALPDASTVTDLTLARKQLGDATTAITDAERVGMSWNDANNLRTAPKYTALQEKIWELEEQEKTKQAEQAKEAAKTNVAAAFAALPEKASGVKKITKIFNKKQQTGDSDKLVAQARLAVKQAEKVWVTPNEIQSILGYEKYKARTGWSEDESNADAPILFELSGEDKDASDKAARAIRADMPKITTLEQVEAMRGRISSDAALEKDPDTRNVLLAALEGRKEWIEKARIDYYSLMMQDLTTNKPVELQQQITDDPKLSWENKNYLIWELQQAKWKAEKKSLRATEQQWKQDFKNFEQEIKLKPLPQDVPELRKRIRESSTLDDEQKVKLQGQINDIERSYWVEETKKLQEAAAIQEYTIAIAALENPDGKDALSKNIETDPRLEGNTTKKAELQGSIDTRLQTLNQEAIAKHEQAISTIQTVAQAEQLKAAIDEDKNLNADDKKDIKGQVDTKAQANSTQTVATFTWTINSLDANSYATQEAWLRDKIAKDETLLPADKESLGKVLDKKGEQLSDADDAPKKEAYTNKINNAANPEELKEIQWEILADKTISDKTEKELLGTIVDASNFGDDAPEDEDRWDDEEVVSEDGAEVFASLWINRKKVLEGSNTVVAQAKKKKIPYVFWSRDIKKWLDCSWFVEHVIENEAKLEYPITGTTSAANVYRQFSDAWYETSVLLKKWETTVNKTGTKPGDLVVRASTNPKFKWRNGKRPAKVNWMPIHHIAIITKVYPDGRIQVAESNGKKWVTETIYTPSKILNGKKPSELHVIHMKYDATEPTPDDRGWAAEQPWNTPELNTTDFQLFQEAYTLFDDSGVYTPEAFKNAKSIYSRISNQEHSDVKGWIRHCNEILAIQSYLDSIWDLLDTEDYSTLKGNLVAANKVVSEDNPKKRYIEEITDFATQLDAIDKAIKSGDKTDAQNKLDQAKSHSQNNEKIIEKLQKRINAMTEWEKKEVTKPAGKALETIETPQLQQKIDAIKNDKTGMIYMIDFYGESCAACKRVAPLLPVFNQWHSTDQKFQALAINTFDPWKKEVNTPIVQQLYPAISYLPDVIFVKNGQVVSSVQWFQGADKGTVFDEWTYLQALETEYQKAKDASTTSSSGARRSWETGTNTESNDTAIIQEATSIKQRADVLYSTKKYAAAKAEYSTMKKKLESLSVAWTERISGGKKNIDDQIQNCQNAIFWQEAMDKAAKLEQEWKKTEAKRAYEAAQVIASKIPNFPDATTAHDKANALQGSGKEQTPTLKDQWALDYRELQNPEELFDLKQTTEQQLARNGLVRTASYFQILDKANIQDKEILTPENHEAILQWFEAFSTAYHKHVANYTIDAATIPQITHLAWLETEQQRIVAGTLDFFQRHTSYKKWSTTFIGLQNYSSTNTFVGDCDLLSMLAQDMLEKQWVNSSFIHLAKANETTPSHAVIAIKPATGNAIWLDFTLATQEDEKYGAADYSSYKKQWPQNSDIETLASFFPTYWINGTQRNIFKRATMAYIFAPKTPLTTKEFLEKDVGYMKLVRDTPISQAEKKSGSISYLVRMHQTLQKKWLLNKDHIGESNLTTLQVNTTAVITVYLNEKEQWKLSYTEVELRDLTTIKENLFFTDEALTGRIDAILQKKNNQESNDQRVENKTTLSPEKVKQKAIDASAEAKSIDDRTTAIAIWEGLLKMLWQDTPENQGWLRNAKEQKKLLEEKKQIDELQKKNSINESEAQFIVDRCNKQITPQTLVFEKLEQTSLLQVVYDNQKPPKPYYYTSNAIQNTLATIKPEHTILVKAPHLMNGTMDLRVKQRIDCCLFVENSPIQPSDLDEADKRRYAISLIRLNADMLKTTRPPVTIPALHYKDEERDAAGRVKDPNDIYRFYLGDGNTYDTKNPFVVLSDEHNLAAADYVKLRAIASSSLQLPNVDDIEDVGDIDLLMTGRSREQWTGYNTTPRWTDIQNTKLSYVQSDFIPTQGASANNYPWVRAMGLYLWLNTLQKAHSEVSKKHHIWVRTIPFEQTELGQETAKNERYKIDYIGQTLSTYQGNTLKLWLGNVTDQALLQHLLTGLVQYRGENGYSYLWLGMPTLSRENARLLGEQSQADRLELYNNVCGTGKDATVFRGLIEFTRKSAEKWMHNKTLIAHKVTWAEFFWWLFNTFASKFTASKEWRGTLYLPDLKRTDFTAQPDLTDKLQLLKSYPWTIRTGDDVYIREGVAYNQKDEYRDTTTKSRTVKKKIKE